MELSLTENFKAFINQQSEQIFSWFREMKPERAPSQGEAFKEVFVAANFTTEQMLSEPFMKQEDSFGNDVSVDFQVDDKMMGYDNQALNILNSLSDKIQKSSNWSNAVSKEYLKKQFYNWSRDKFLGKTTSEFSQYLMGNALSAIRDYEIVTPIRYTSTSNNIQIGRVVFKNLSPSLVQSWIEGVNKSNSNKSDPKPFDNRDYTDYQGYIACTVKVYSEEVRAKELARIESERSLVFLRYFHPTNLHPLFASYCDIYSKDTVPSAIHYVLEAEYPRVQKHSADRNFRPWFIEKVSVDLINKMSKEYFEPMVSKDASEFQVKVFRSLELYSRNNLHSKIEDKILYIIVSLEAILLKKKEQTKKEFLSERLTALISRHLKNRESAKQLVQTVYKFRSNFVHEGAGIDQILPLMHFMKLTWIFYFELIEVSKKYATKSDFLKDLEEK